MSADVKREPGSVGASVLAPGEQAAEGTIWKPARKGRPPPLRLDATRKANSAPKGSQGDDVESDTDSEADLVIDERSDAGNSAEDSSFRAVQWSLVMNLPSQSANEGSDSEDEFVVVDDVYTGPQECAEKFKLSLNNGRPDNTVETVNPVKNPTVPREKHSNGPILKDDYVMCFRQFTKAKSGIGKPDPDPAPRRNARDGVFRPNELRTEMNRCAGELKNIADNIFENNFPVKQEPLETDGGAWPSSDIIVNARNIKKEATDDQEEFADMDAFIDSHFEEYFEETPGGEESPDGLDCSGEEDSIGSNGSSPDKLRFKHDCIKCGKAFQLKSSLNRHQRVHWDVAHFCDLCRKYFKTSGNLKKHILSKHASGQDSTADKPRRDSVSLTCSVCKKSMRNQSALSHHSLVHSNVRPFKCNICRASFKEKPTLRRHMSTHLEKQHACGLCQKRFVEKNSLHRHIRTLHSEERPSKNGEVLTCPICQHTFKSVDKLERHNRCHGDPNFECSVCRKVYAGPSHLKIHTRIHTGEKPYRCNVCRVSFTFKHVLLSHMIRLHKHTDRFKCNLCAATFNRKIELANHLTTHLTETPIIPDDGAVKMDRVKKLRTSIMLLNKVLPTDGSDL